MRHHRTPVLTLALLLALGATARAQPAQKPIPTGELTGPFRARLDGPAGVREVDLHIHSPGPSELRADLDGLALVLGRVGTELVLTGTAKRKAGLVNVLSGPSGPFQARLTVGDRNTLEGTLTDVEGGAVTKVALARRVLLPRAPGELEEHDAGPPLALAQIFARNPDYAEFRQAYWYDFGPVFYRGRLDGSARVLCIASDPGPTECLPFVRRCLVGDAGQRVQGFLNKVGLTRSYVLLNANTYALRPSQATQGARNMRKPEQVAWREELYSAAAGEELQAIVLFGAQARAAFKLWAGKPTNVPVIDLPHPSSHDPQVLVDAYRAAVTQLRELVTPDEDGRLDLPNYGPEWREEDYARIPRRDLPAEAPDFVGDDSWGRADSPRHNNCVKRPSPDDRRTLLLVTPTGQRFRYRVPQVLQHSNAVPVFTKEQLQ
jgi:hypothetical protein